jgi:hypothetical protein
MVFNYFFHEDRNLQVNSNSVPVLQHYYTGVPVPNLLNFYFDTFLN